MNSRVMAVVSAAAVALGTGTYVVAQTTEPPPVLPKFSADLCGSYLEKTPLQLRTSVRRELEPLKIKGAYRECIVRAVTFLGPGVIDDCLNEDFAAQEQDNWQDEMTQAFIQCAPGPVPPPPPVEEPPAS